eukprot:364511-Chlamydomonas_euryale.AAC.6
MVSVLRVEVWKSRVPSVPVARVQQDDWQSNYGVGVGVEAWKTRVPSVPVARVQQDHWQSNYGAGVECGGVEDASAECAYSSSAAGQLTAWI